MKQNNEVNKLDDLFSSIESAIVIGYIKDILIRLVLIVVLCIASWYIISI